MQEQYYHLSQQTPCSPLVITMIDGATGHHKPPMTSYIYLSVSVVCWLFALTVPILTVYVYDLLFNYIAFVVAVLRLWLIAFPVNSQSKEHSHKIFHNNWRLFFSLLSQGSYSSLNLSIAMTHCHKIARISRSA